MIDDDRLSMMSCSVIPGRKLSVNQTSDTLSKYMRDSASEGQKMALNVFKFITFLENAFSRYGS